LSIAAGLSFAAAALVLSCNLVVARANAYETSDPARVPSRPIAIIFGAGLNPDGTPSGMLADRIDGGIALLRAHRVHGLLFTGDNGTVTYNELAAMRKYALAHGVPPSALTEDYAGFDTYDSCYRARTIFGVRAAVLVTQGFHLGRALFLCRAMGIDAVGLSEPDWSKYDHRMMFDLTLREYLARTRAVVDVAFHRRATLLGPRESVNLSATSLSPRPRRR
jgi:vancomycin permeability regulator SanA